MNAGDHHYKAYVGPPAQYDFMGASQFRLLCALGLREHNNLLDFGCGSLRAGRLFLTYLDKGNYYGIEPNEWLIKDAIINQIGDDLIKIKKPVFDNNVDFSIGFETKFDFILAQSIFSHTGIDLTRIILRNFKKSLQNNGLIVVTFIDSFKDFSGGGWIYPGITCYKPSTVKAIAKQEGLFVTRIPWYHPRQTWYLFASDKDRLPNWTMKKCLKGSVLFDQELASSWKGMQRSLELIVRYIVTGLPLHVQHKVQGWLMNRKKK